MKSYYISGCQYVGEISNWSGYLIVKPGEDINKAICRKFGIDNIYSTAGMQSREVPIETVPVVELTVGELIEIATQIKYKGGVST